MDKDREQPTRKPPSGPEIPNEDELKRMADFYGKPEQSEEEPAHSPTPTRGKQEKRPEAEKKTDAEKRPPQRMAASDMEEISSGTKENRLKRFYSTKTKTKITLTVLLSLLLIAVLVIGGFGLSKLAKIHFNNGNDFNTPSEELYPEYNFNAMDDVENASSIKEILRQWATNGGEKLKSKNVINVLLLGLDTRQGESDGPMVSHADSIILASLNKKTKTITLVSLMRDSYTYANTDKERYCKLTEVFFWGGPQALIETIENDFKIEVDDYVSVNFETFPKVIDAVGGVEIDVTEAEAHWLSTNEEYNDPIPTDPGFQLMDGAHALAYSRIRHLDSDTRRAERQRYVLTQLIEKSKTASAGQINDLLDAVLPNIATSFGRAELVSLGTKAFLYGWMNYDIQQRSMPEETDSWGGMLGDKWYWVVDFPASAQKLQMALYGMTNINLKEDRITAVDLSPGGKKSGKNTNDGTTAIQTTASQTKPNHTTTQSDTSRPPTRPSTGRTTTEPLSSTTARPTTAEPESEEDLPAQETGSGRAAVGLGE